VFTPALDLTVGDLSSELLELLAFSTNLGENTYVMFSKKFIAKMLLPKNLTISLFLILPIITYATGYHIGKIQSIKTISSSQISELNPTPTSLPTLKFTHEFIIKELGVKIKVPEEIANDLVYKHENNAAYFSTKSITKADPSCGPSDAPLGILGKVYKNSPRSEIAKNLTKSRIDEGYSDTIVYPTAKEFDNFYIEYSGPQALCSTSSQVGKLISTSSYFFNAGGILASMQSLK
jgi:hypothetical protein